MAKEKKAKTKSVSYAKWGYIFILPFFVTYLFWSLVPQLLTFFYSFFNIYTEGLEQVGPTWVGLDNYKALFTTTLSTSIGEVPSIIKYTINTMLMWVMGAIPQFIIALLLAVWFTNLRLNIKGQGFFKTVIYMPNLIMASAFSMLVWTLISKVGPINQLLIEIGKVSADSPIDFLASETSARVVVAIVNFLMWFGNTTIVLMAGIMGIDGSLFEAAMIDGANNTKVFFKVTLPLLLPILTYSVITSLLGGINMYDVPYIFSNGKGTPNNSTTTLIMSVQSRIMPSKNYGSAGALSVLIFLFAAVFSFIVYKFFLNQYKPKENKKGGRK